MRKDYGRHKHTNWRFLFVWLVQMSAAAAFFLISLGAFVLCRWGLFSRLEWIPGPEEIPAPQNLELHIQGHEICHDIRMAVDWFKTLCARYYSFCIILLLVLFLILVEAWAALLNRITAAGEIRRYDV